MLHINIRQPRETFQQLQVKIKQVKDLTYPHSTDVFSEQISSVVQKNRYSQRHKKQREARAASILSANNIPLIKSKNISRKPQLN